MGVILGKTSMDAIKKQKNELARRIPQIELEGSSKPEGTATIDFKSMSNDELLRSLEK